MTHLNSDFTFYRNSNNPTSEEKEEERNRRWGRVIDFVPKLFMGTKKQDLPFPSCLDTAFAWEESGLAKGLLLYGPTGSGKSRIMWELVKKQVMRGKCITAVNSFSIAQYPSMLMAGEDTAGKFSKQMVKAATLFLDDVFKAKLTERVEELLFSAIDERINHESPTVITLNDTGDSLIARMSPDRGAALVRRLREFTTIFVGNVTIQKSNKVVVS